MPEQELPIKTDIALDLSENLPPDLHSIGQTRLISLISNHSAESDVWLGEQTNGERVAVKIYRYGRIPGLVEESQKCAGVQFLPGRLESMKREVRVNRQLAALSHDDRRSLRRLVRRWMRSLRRASRAERRIRIRDR